MPALTAAIIGGVLAATATYQAVSANQAKQDAKGVANEQEDNANKATQAVKAQTQAANDAGANQVTQDAAKNRQQQIMGAAGGRGSTILTSPLGAPAAPNVASKTLLGM